VGHHSTSDDSTKYRPVDEIEWWKLARDPVTRFGKWIESNGWWSTEAESEFRSSVRKQVEPTYLKTQFQDNMYNKIQHYAFFNSIVSELFS
jgi:TPP-dependent pyruvate/acetoin dehydrogenase alpha subunit